MRNPKRAPNKVEDGMMIIHLTRRWMELVPSCVGGLSLWRIRSVNDVGRVGEKVSTGIIIACFVLRCQKREQSILDKAYYYPY